MWKTSGGDNGGDQRDHVDIMLDIRWSLWSRSATTTGRDCERDKGGEQEDITEEIIEDIKEEIRWEKWVRQWEKMVGWIKT